MELLIGKQFKMPVLEEFIKTMRVGEVSRFGAIKSLVANYPFVSQAYRKFAKKHDHDHDGHSHDDDHSSGHQCGMSMKNGLGHPDLDDLLKCPTKLDFVIELLKVELPQDYDKEVWQMEHEEQLSSIPRLKEEGNQLYKAGQIQQAVERYGKALSILEQLMLKEKPQDEDWLTLDRLKVPLLSNFAQCKLIQKEFYAVIEHSNEIIKREPDNVKALFRRGKAHAAVWNNEEAKADFHKVRTIDPSLDKMVLKELNAIELAQKNKDEEDKAKFKGKMF